MSVSANDSPKVSLRAFLAKYSVLIAFAAIVIFFAVASPTFLTPANLFNVLVNNVVMAATASWRRTASRASPTSREWRSG